MDAMWHRLKVGIAPVAVMLFLAACGDKPQAPVPQIAPQKPLQQEREALEQAKGAEQTGAKHAAELQQQAKKQAQ